MTLRANASARKWIPETPSAALGLRSDWREIAIGVSIGIAIVAGMAVESSAMTAAAALAAALVAVASPFTGLTILAFMMPLKPPLVIPAPGFNLMLVGATLVGCLYRLPIDRPRARLNAALLLFGAYIAYIGVQHLPELLAGYSTNDDHEVGFLFLQVAAGFGLVVAAAYLLRGRSPYPILTVALVGATLAGLIAILTYDHPPAGPPLAGLVALPDRAVRAAGPFGNPNYLGTLVSLTAVIGASLLTVVRTRRARAFLATAVAVAVGALLFSQSRGALIAAFLGFASLTWARSRRLAIIVVGVGVIAAVVLYPAFVEWRLANLGVQRAATITDSDEGRLEGTLAGFQLFLQSPILGIGFGHYTSMSVLVPGIHSPINAHNWYVNVLAEQGLVGAVLWVLLTIAVIREVLTRPIVAQRLAIPILGALAGAFLFLEAPMSFQTFSLPMLALVAALRGQWPGFQTNPPVGSAIATPRPIAQDT